MNTAENIFQLTEPTELEYLVNFAAPFTGSGKCLVPSGVIFHVTGPMGPAEYYLSLDEEHQDCTGLIYVMEEMAKEKYPRMAGVPLDFTFFIDKNQIRTLPLRFLKGSKVGLL